MTNAADNLFDEDIILQGRWGPFDLRRYTLRKPHTRPQFLGDREIKNKVFAITAGSSLPERSVIYVTKHGLHALEAMDEMHEAFARRRYGLSVGPSEYDAIGRLPHINVREDREDDVLSSSSFPDVLRVEREDDGSFTAVIAERRAA